MRQPPKVVSNPVDLIGGVTDFAEEIRKLVDDVCAEVPKTVGRYWGCADEAAVLTREVLEAAFDEIRYGPLPTVDDILNEGLEPDLRPWAEHPAQRKVMAWGA